MARLNGSIENRGNGKYGLTVSGGTDADGKRIRHRKTIEAASGTEADRELIRYIAELEGSDFYEPEKLHFKTFALKWLAEYAEPELAPKTYVRYKEMLEKRAIPALGNFTMDKLRPMHIVEFYNSLRKDGARLDGKPGGLSPSTVRHHHRMLSSLFSTAAEWGVVKENIITKVKPPKTKSKKATAYGPEEAAAMLVALDNEPLKWKSLVHLAIATGLRLGELLGLEWQDIDFETATLEVNRASQSLKGYGTFTKDPKNDDSRRLISIPASTLLILKEYRKEWIEQRLRTGDLWHETDRLWVQWNGKPMHTSSPSGWFPKFLKRHGLPHMGFHGLRHTSATLLIAQGTDVRTVSGRLGHAQTSTTMNIYSHFLQTADEAAANVMDSILYQATKTL